MTVRTRFAPSPTGFLHIGNIRTALFSFLFARHSGGKFILRIEDTDVERSKAEYSNAILHDLKLLGLEWDEGPFYQSERLAVYTESLKRLEEQGRVYPCYCTAEELKARRKEALLMKRPPRYDNRCRTISDEEKKKREASGIRPTIRFKVDETGPIMVHDLIRGDVAFHPEEFGDFVIMRCHPSKPDVFLPTFHLSVCVDDGLMGITHVIRGEDHLSNSPRHVLLFKALGFNVPNFAHLSLIHGEGGGPLSKRLTSMSVRDFIEREGYLPEALLNYLSLLGWSPKDNREIMSLEEITREFDLANVTKHPAIFNDEKLDWVNGEHVRRLSEVVYHGQARHFLEISSQSPAKTFFADRDRLEKCLSLVRTDIKKFSDLFERLQFLPEPEESALGEEEKAALSTPEAKQVLQAAAEILPFLASKGEALFDELAGRLKEKTNQKGKALFMPIRIAVTGHAHGPELKKIFGIFEPDLIQKRFRNALAFCPS